MPDQDETQALIRGLHAGDRDAWTRLYSLYSGRVWRYVARLLGSDAQSVADIVQETLLSAARSARGFDPQRGSFWNWLSGIAQHQAQAYWRQESRANRLKQLAEAGAADVWHWLERAEGANDPWPRHDLADLVRSVLADMSAENADLVTSKYLDGRTLEELSYDRACSVDAVKSKLARARREFRAKFERMSQTPTPAGEG